MGNNIAILFQHSAQACVPQTQNSSVMETLVPKYYALELTFTLSNTPHAGTFFHPLSSAKAYVIPNHPK